MGIEPTDSHRMGEERTGGRTWDSHMWSLQSELEDHATLQQQISELVRAVRDAGRRPADVPGGRDAVLVRLLYQHAGDSLRLTPELLRDVADLGAEIDLSIYVTDGP